jgi:hypothetical protein
VIENDHEITPQFLTMQLMGTEKTFCDMNPFYIQKNLNSKAGKVQNASCLRSGTLLVDVCNEKWLDKLLKTTFRGLHLMKVERCATLICF